MEDIQKSFKISRQKQKRESPFLFLYVVFQQFI